MIDEIVTFFGGQTKLALLLGIDKAAISNWRKEGIPPLRAIEIEKLSIGKFKAIDISGEK